MGRLRIFMCGDLVVLGEFVGADDVGKDDAVVWGGGVATAAFGARAEKGDECEWIGELGTGSGVDGGVHKEVGVSKEAIEQKASNRTAAFKRVAAKKAPQRFSRDSTAPATQTIVVKPAAAKKPAVKSAPKVAAQRPAARKTSATAARPAARKAAARKPASRAK